MLRPGSALGESPSFESCTSSKLAEIAARVVNELKLTDERYGDIFYSYVDGPSDGASVEETEGRSCAECEEEEEENLSREPNDDVGVNENGNETEGEGEEEDDDDDDDGEFEFHVLCGGDNSSPISADEIFDNGQIKPMYPIFNTDLVFRSGADGGLHPPDRESVDESKLPPQSGAGSQSASAASSVRFPLRKLFVEEREAASCSSSEADDLDGVPQETYCVWTPGAPRQEMSKKSNSTGSGSSRRWKFRDLMYRSQSDGRDAYFFLSPHHQRQRQQGHQQTAGLNKVEEPKAEKEKEAKSGGGRKRTTAVGGAGKRGNVHEKHYLMNRAMREDDRKKSYLPYRQDLMGFFANANGLSRTVQPF